MAQMEKNSSFKLTGNGTPFSPSLNSLLSLPSSKSQLNRGNLQTYDGETIHGQQKHDLISESDNSIDLEEEVSPSRIRRDSSITIQKDILLPRMSNDSCTTIFPRKIQNQSDRPCTHILLQKNEKLEESNTNTLTREVSGCTCRSEKASQNYIVQIKSEPTTIVITRRGSTNSITAVGSCARFRAGGSDQENPRKGKKSKNSVPEEDSKAPLTVWERKDSDERLGSTSGESIAARSSTDTDSKRSPKRKDTYLKRLSTRLSGGGSKQAGSKRSPGSSPRSKRRERDMIDDEFKSKFNKAVVPKNPRFLGRGRKTGREGEGEENANKSEGSNKREGRSKSSFFSKNKRKGTPSRSRSRSVTRSSSKSRSPQPKQSPKTSEEPFYYKESSSPQTSSQSVNQELVTSVQHQSIQTDPLISQPGTMDKPGAICCSCGNAILASADDYTGTPTEEPEKTQADEQQQPESKPHRKMVFSVRSDVRSTVAYDAFVELDGSETNSESHPVDYKDVQTPQSPKQASGSEHDSMNRPRSPVGPEVKNTESHPTAYKDLQTPNSPKQASGSEHGSGIQRSHSPASTSPSRSHYIMIAKQSKTTSPASGSKEAVPEEGVKVAKSVSYQTTTQSSGPEDAVTVYCDHCGCGLQTVLADSLPDHGAAVSKKDSKVSQVLWALAKVTVFKDGTRNFDILESTSIPPGHYLMPGNEEFVLIPINH